MIIARTLGRRLVFGVGGLALALTGVAPTAAAAGPPPTDRMVVSDVITPPSGTNYFGGRIVLSGDGRTAAMLQLWPDPGSQAPAVVVTTLGDPPADSGWTRSAEFYPGGTVFAAALSYDGSVLAVTRPDLDARGAVRVEVYSRAGARWQPQAFWLLPNSDDDVRRVVMSGNGDRILVGTSYGADPGEQEVSAWRRSGPGWVPDRLPADLSPREGLTLAISADGSTALMSGADQNRAPGVLRYSADGWTRAGTLPSPTYRATRFDQMALSSDGAVAAVGTQEGESATVLRRDPDGGYRIAGRFRPDSPSESYFGNSVALSADGGVLLVGAPGRSTSETRRAGGVYRYLWTGTGWRWGGLLDVGNPRRQDLLGSSTAISADGATVLSATPYRRPDQDSGFVGSGMVVVYRLR